MCYKSRAVTRLLIVKPRLRSISSDERSCQEIVDFRLFTRDKDPGTGIGLAICRKVIEERGGKIWVENDHFLVRTRQNDFGSWGVPLIPR